MVQKAVPAFPPSALLLMTEIRHISPAHQARCQPSPCSCKPGERWGPFPCSTRAVRCKSPLKAPSLHREGHTAWQHRTGDPWISWRGHLQEASSYLEIAQVLVICVCVRVCIMCIYGSDLVFLHDFWRLFFVTVAAPAKTVQNRQNLETSGPPLRQSRGMYHVIYAEILKMLSKPRF